MKDGNTEGSTRKKAEEKGMAKARGELSITYDMLHGGDQLDDGTRVLYNQRSFALRAAQWQRIAVHTTQAETQSCLHSAHCVSYSLAYGFNTAAAALKNCITEEQNHQPISLLLSFPAKNGPASTAPRQRRARAAEWLCTTYEKKNMTVDLFVSHSSMKV